MKFEFFSPWPCSFSGTHSLSLKPFPVVLAVGLMNLRCHIPLRLTSCKCFLLCSLVLTIEIGLCMKGPREAWVTSSTGPDANCTLGSSHCCGWQKANILQIPPHFVVALEICPHELLLSSPSYNLVGSTQQSCSLKTEFHWETKLWTIAKESPLETVNTE